MTTTFPTRPARADVPAATAATYIAFIALGLAFASWASRIPQVRDRLSLDPSELGLVLLAIAAGSLLALPLSGPVVARFGSRRTVNAMAVLLGVGLGTVALGYLAGLAPVLPGLFVVGFAMGAWDVAMNVQGTVVEQHLGRSIMSRFHAGYSLGTVAGALAGAAMVALHVPVPVHLCAVALFIAVGVPLSTRRFIADQEEAQEEARQETREEARGEARQETRAVRVAKERGRRSRGGALAAWREPRTLLIGVFVLAFAFAEGTGNDWVSVAAIDGHHMAPAVGALMFASFLTAMMVGRWFGPGLLDRYGRVPVIRVLSVVGIAGTALFVLAPSGGYAFAGALLWGVGVSLGFPVGMSAAADDPRHAARRVSVVASVGYCAFLAGPPVVGLLGDRTTVLRALLSVAVLLGLAALLATSVGPLSATAPDATDATGQAAGTPRPDATDATGQAAGTPRPEAAVTRS